MINLILSDLYRLARGVNIRGWALGTVAAVLLCWGICWLCTTFFADLAMNTLSSQSGTNALISAGYNPELLEEMLNADTIFGTETAFSFVDKWVESPTGAWGTIIMAGGGYFPLFVSFAAVLAVGPDVKGFGKTVLATRRGRGAYYASKFVLAALVSLTLLIVAIIACEIGRIAAGFSYQGMDSGAEILLFIGLSWLVGTMYAIVSLTVMLAARSFAAGIAAVCIFGAGVIDMVLYAICSVLATAFPVAERIAGFLPVNLPYVLASGDLASFAALESLPVPGLSAAGYVLLVSGVLIAVCIIITVSYSRKRDIA